MKDLLALGIELGSTRIKAVAIDGTYRPAVSGEYTWENRLENGYWTYSLEEVWTGLRAALAGLSGREPAVMGISGMMHGYLAFDRNWNLLTPFRTWRNTTTGPAAAELTEAFAFNIPQRWSAAHLYQAILNGEPHVSQAAHITTLAGYVHYRLTGVNVLGIGDASGMFPIDSDTLTYRQDLLERFDALAARRGCPLSLRSLLPQPLTAGEDAGVLTAGGAALLGGLLPPGIPFCPPEGDAGTGMTATNAVAARTGNVSAGTSVFSMAVLERPLSRVYQAIDMVVTPVGAPVAMVHCNTCTSDLDAWVRVFGEALEAAGAGLDKPALYGLLYRKALEGDADCGGLTAFNCYSGEPVAGVDSPYAAAGGQAVPGQPDARPPVRRHGGAENGHGPAHRRGGGDAGSAPGSRRPLQNAGRRPAADGRGSRRAGGGDGDGGGGRPLGHGPAGRVQNPANRDAASGCLSGPAGISRRTLPPRGAPGR